MYCPVCFQNTLKVRSTGVIKLTFNGKSRNTSLFTYNLQKETGPELEKKLKEKVADFFSWYAEFKNRTPIKTVEVFSGDFVCTNQCKIDVINTKLNVIGLVYTPDKLKSILQEEGKKWNIDVEFDPHKI